MVLPKRPTACLGSTAPEESKVGFDNSGYSELAVARLLSYSASEVVASNSTTSLNLRRRGSYCCWGSLESRQKLMKGIKRPATTAPFHSRRMLFIRVSEENFSCARVCRRNPGTGLKYTRKYNVIA